MVTDYDCWHQTHQEVSVEMVLENLRANTEVANKIVFKIAKFIDRTNNRPATFFNKGAVAHVTMGDPFCRNLSGILSNVGEKNIPGGRQLHRGGTYLAMEGPAFSTRAESNLYRSWGCSIIGMTNHTEARLAKEAEIAY